jgi:hypothetical protein
LLVQPLFTGVLSLPPLPSFLLELLRGFMLDLLSFPLLLLSRRVVQTLNPVRLPQVVHRLGRTTVHSLQFELFFVISPLFLLDLVVFEALKVASYLEKTLFAVDSLWWRQVGLKFM